MVRLAGHPDAFVDGRDQLSLDPPPLRTIKDGGFFDHDRSVIDEEASTKALVMILAGSKSNHSSGDV